MAKLVSFDGDLDKQVWDNILAYGLTLEPTTQKNYGLILRNWLNFLGSDPALKGSGKVFVNAEMKDAIKYIKYLQKQGYASSTVVDKIKYVKSSYTKLKNYGVLKRNPFSLVRNPKIKGYPLQRKIVKFSDVKKLINAPGGDLIGLRDSAMLGVLFASAIRGSELVKLKREDLVSFEEYYFLFLEDTKNGESANQAMADFAVRPLKKWLDASEALNCPYMFFSLSSNTEYKPLTTKTLGNVFKKHVRKFCADEKVSTHSARVTAISKLLFDGHDVRVVQEFSRHAKVDTVIGYERTIKNIKDSVGYQLNF